MPDKDKYFLFLGRLSNEKGITTLVKAFKECPDSKLIVAGTGPLEKELIQYKEQNKLNNIYFVGYKSGEELQELKKKAYFVIVPSECYENNPMAIIEAYAEGVPAIGANIGGIPEIIISNKTGFTFEMGNTASLAEMIQHASSLSVQEYKTMSENSIKYALEDMSKDSYYNRLIPFYQKFINQIQ